MTTNHIQIMIAENPIMKAWDCAVMVGGFKTRKEAEEVAAKIKEYLEGAGGATFMRKQ